jgi:ZIP family zinc transporter
MSGFAEAAAWGAAVGGSLVLGAVAAWLLDLPQRVSAILTAFGGGLLFAAVALELVPDADEQAGVALTSVGLLAGTLLYVGIDSWLARNQEMKQTRTAMHASAAGSPEGRKGGEVARGESIAVGLTVDGIPESVALGLTIAQGELGLALLVGVLIGNVVEAYGAAEPILAGGKSPRFAVGLMAIIGGLLMLATILGGTALADASAELIGTAQAVAAGAIVAVVAIAIIPHAFDEVSREVAVATTVGFVVGYLFA